MSWHVVEVTPERDLDIPDQWCHDNCRGAWDTERSRAWVTLWQFEDAQDAVLFKLTWGGK